MTLHALLSDARPPNSAITGYITEGGTLYLRTAVHWTVLTPGANDAQRWMHTMSGACECAVCAFIRVRVCVCVCVCVCVFKSVSVTGFLPLIALLESSFWCRLMSAFCSHNAISPSAEIALPLSQSCSFMRHNSQFVSVTCAVRRSAQDARLHFQVSLQKRSWFNNAEIIFRLTWKRLR